MELPVRMSEHQQHPCVAGTSGFRSACKSVGKVLWSKTTGGSLLGKGASVEYFYKRLVLIAFFGLAPFSGNPSCLPARQFLALVICRGEEGSTGC